MPKSKTKKGEKILFRRLKKNLLPLSLSIILFILILLAFEIFIADKYNLLTFINDANVSLLTQSEAKQAVSANFTKKQQQKLNLISDKGQFSLDLATSSAKLDYFVADEEFSKQKMGTFFDQIRKQLQSLVSHQSFYLKVSFNLDSQIASIAQAVDVLPQDAQIAFDESGNEATPSAHIQIKEGKNGQALDKASLKKIVSDYLVSAKLPSSLPIQIVQPKITTAYVTKVKEALEQSQRESLKLKFQGNIYVLDTKQLLTLLDLTKGSSLLLDEGKSKAYIQKIASQLDQDVQEGQFEFNPGTKRVTVFKPSLEGRKLDLDLTFKLLSDAFLGKSNKNIELPVTIIKPKIETADVNNLGIKELIGRGISNFAGSIQNRIYNVNLTAAKINGVLIPPNEVFSFNQTVGDITAATGFKQAYVIKEGRTVLDDGGGVCQDSTTLFRAVLNAGLPVVARTAHAYRVGYYEQGFPPGLDATVFYPSVDFQFKNDTPAHILIQAYTSGLTLYVDLYGTSDGRVASISKSIVTDQTPPPLDLRQDDPTLPKGVVKQVDFSAWGANVTFTRTVSRNGETLAKETWRSSYKPWQAVYLVGTKEN